MAPLAPCLRLWAAERNTAARLNSDEVTETIS